MRPVFRKHPAHIAGDRKHGRMCSRRARNRACGFRDQAFRATKVRKGRGSASRTAHSTVFSVISGSARHLPVFGRIRSLHEEASHLFDDERVGSKGCVHGARRRWSNSGRIHVACGKQKRVSPYNSQAHTVSLTIELKVRALWPITRECSPERRRASQGAEAGRGRLVGDVTAGAG